MVGEWRWASKMMVGGCKPLQKLQGIRCSAGLTEKMQSEWVRLCGSRGEGGVALWRSGGVQVVSRERRSPGGLVGVGAQCAALRHCEARNAVHDAVRSSGASLSRAKPWLASGAAVCRYSSLGTNWAVTPRELSTGPLRILTSPVPRSVASTAASRYATASVNGGGGSGNEGGGGGGGGGGDGSGEAGDGGKPRGFWAFWAWYMGWLDSRPIFTKAITSSILTFVGDLFCQVVVEGAQNPDGKRIFIMSSLGFLLTGPTLHFWYLALYKYVTVTGPAGVGVRLLLDQFLFSPTFITVFMSSLMTLEGKSDQIPAKLKQDLWPAIVMNWKLWIPAQTINFLLVPQKLQVGFANIVALGWNTYLSYQSHKQIVAVEDIPEKTS